MKEAFLKAVVAGNVDSLSLLLEDGADVEFAFEHGRTALHIAADTGNVSVCNNRTFVCSFFSKFSFAKRLPRRSLKHKPT